MSARRFFIAIFFSVLFVSAGAQTSGMVKKKAVAATPVLKTETFQVLGNCGMCEKTIENAAATAGATSADWDADKNLLTVAFDSAQTTVDAIQKAVARSGYDNAGYKAPDEAYDKLHACCHYDRSGAPGTAKSCEEGEKN